VFECGRGNFEIELFVAELCCEPSPSAGNPNRQGQNALAVSSRRKIQPISELLRKLDQQTAARLVSGLSRDLPGPTERAEIAEFHFCAITSFSELATALYSEPASRREHLWKSAIDAAAVWLNAAIRL
jgi:hypothetical protein